jgi:hypothetical protein
VKKTFLIVAALVSFTAFAFAEDFTITIDVAPNVLNLQKTVDKCVTVHTNILYNEVNHEKSKVLLLAGNGYTEAYSCFSDDRGYFVAKFWREAVGDLVSVGYNTFTLTGFNVDGEAFSGAQDILVVDNVAPGR